MCALRQSSTTVHKHLCVNSSLVTAVGAYTAVCERVCVWVCVSMYLLIDGVTAGCQAYLQPHTSLFPFAPALPSHRSLPSSFNLAAEAKESGSHQGTLLIFKGHTHASFFPPVALLCLFTLPRLHSPPSSIGSSSSSLQFCRYINLSRLSCLLCRQSAQKLWFQTTCQFCPPPITHPTHLFVWIQTFHLFVLSWEYELIWNLKYHWECQIRPHIESGFLFNSYMCFSYVWILHIDVWHTAPPPSLLMYSLYFCISWGIIPELINFYFATFCKGDNKRIIKKLQ